MKVKAVRISKQAMSPFHEGFSEIRISLSDSDQEHASGLELALSQLANLGSVVSSRNFFFAEEDNQTH